MRAASFNYELARRAIMLNGVTQAALTKTDMTFLGCKEVKSYEELPKEAKLSSRGLKKKLRYQ